MSNISLIMFAAGDSTRSNMGVKKQFIRLGDDPPWLFATKNLSSFYSFKKIIVTSSNISYMRKFAKNYEFVQGEASRMQLSKNALNLIESEFVMVSDVARILISKNLFNRLLENIHNADCITPVLKVCDTALYEDEQSLQREKIKLIQTPQLSRIALLKKALQIGQEFTNDSTTITAVGGKIWFVSGEENARKTTFKEDLKKFKLPAPSKDIFTGNGFDVYEFGEKRALLLGGVEIHPIMGLKAHSDGDVLAHVLSDALLGASSLGGIGELFPDADLKYKNADSMKLLAQIYTQIRQYGFTCANIDITILAQKPKIGDFKKGIAKNIAQILDLDEFRVNTKATTTEKLGLIGRSEGIAVQASVNLKHFDWTK